ncbi:MAG: class I SAM-dependent methyltransferase [Myxococcota bacterium]
MVEQGSLYDEPAVYEMLFRGRHHDFDFYRAAAARWGSAFVLDVGTGTGRIAFELAARGHHVFGIDTSRAMLARLERRLKEVDPAIRERIQWAQTTAEAHPQAASFDLAICPFNGIAHCGEPTELAPFLAALRGHLRPGGCFVFDVLVMDPRRCREERNDFPWFRHPATGGVCRATDRRWFDPSSGVLETSLEIRFMEEERPPQSLSLRMTLHSVGAWEAALADQGFVVQATEALGDVVGIVAEPAPSPTVV